MNSATALKPWSFTARERDIVDAVLDPASPLGKPTRPTRDIEQVEAAMLKVIRTQCAPIRPAELMDMLKPVTESQCRRALLRLADRQEVRITSDRKVEAWR